MKCRICHSDKFEMFLNLGEQPLADDFLTKEQLSQPEAVYPLEVYFCHDCTLVQLGYVVPPEVLYNDDYPYETGVNKDGVKHFRKLAEEVVSKCDLQDGDLVVDIGSNDGTLLEQFRNLRMDVYGIEPVAEIAEYAKVSTLNEFFNKEVVNKWNKAYPVKVITATNVVAHIDDLHSFVKNIKTLLADDGVFVMEVPFLADMINKVAFDQIYHEHLSYFSVKPLQRLFEMHDMKIINAEWQDVHGGSMRYYVGKEPQKSWLVSYGDEITLDKLIKFGCDSAINASVLYGTLNALKQEGNTIVVVSLPAKGNTLLNFSRIDKEILDYITEKSKKKIGKYTPGTHIPIVPDKKLIEDSPDYAVILAHNWSKQIASSLINMGYEGKWIIPNEIEQQNFSLGSDRSCRLRSKKRATA